MKRYLPIFIIIAIVSFSVGISINANESDSDSFLTEPISTPWNVNNEEDKEVAAIEFVDEHLYILKDETVITVAVTVSSEAITVVYYHPESELFLLEKYKNDVLVQSLDLSGAFSAGKEEHDSAGILELTEFDKGKFSHNGKLTYLIQRLLYIIYMFSLLIFKLNKKQSFIFLMICDVIMILSCLISLDNRLWYIIASAIIAHSLHFSQFKKKI